MHNVKHIFSVCVVKEIQGPLCAVLLKFKINSAALLGAQVA